MPGCLKSNLTLSLLTVAVVVLQGQVLLTVAQSIYTSPVHIQVQQVQHNYGISFSLESLKPHSVHL